MVSRVLTLGSLAALVQAKAIITNHCDATVYLSSVPERDGVADKLPLAPGKQYVEPWRYGTKDTPGIAIKITPDQRDVGEGRAWWWGNWEVNLSYTVDPNDPTKVWIDRSQPKPTSPRSALFSCNNWHWNLPMVTVHSCALTDNAELALCGQQRSTSPKDMTPARTIDACIGRVHERDASIEPRQCNGRVVGPKPKHERRASEGHDQGVGNDAHMDIDLVHGKYDDNNAHMDIGILHMDLEVPATDFPDILEPDSPDIALPDDNERLVTIPLKDIMRHEAAKHTRATKSEPLCELVRKQWPDAACDEGMSQQNARLFYEDNCGPKTKDMVPGVDCQKLREEIKTIWPDVSKAPKDSAAQKITVQAPQSHEIRVCADQHCAQHPDTPCWKIKKSLEILNPGYDFTTSDEECDKEPKSYRAANVTAPGPRSHRHHDHRLRMCVRDFCRAQPAKSCHLVEKELEAANPGLDFTTSDDECKPKPHSKRSKPKTVLSVNTTVRAFHGVVREVCATKAYNKLGHLWGDFDATLHVLDELFDDVAWTDDEEVCNRSPTTYPHPKDEEERCVKSYCQLPRFPNVDCDYVKHILEDLSEDVGHHIDWTSDDDVCHGGKKRKHGSKGSHEPKTGPKVNATAPAERGNKKCVLPLCRQRPTENCNDIEKEMEAKFPGVDYTSSDEECGGSVPTVPKPGPSVNVTTPTPPVVMRQLCIHDARRMFRLMKWTPPSVVMMLNHLFADVQWTADKAICDTLPPPRYPLGLKERRCIKRWAEGRADDVDVMRSRRLWRNCPRMRVTTPTGRLILTSATKKASHRGHEQIAFACDLVDAMVGFVLWMAR